MIEVIYIGGGCFWGMEHLFKNFTGVVDTEVGYAGGREGNPTYYNHNGHAETLKVSYSTEQASYEDMLGCFFNIHDPTTLNQQGNDIGTSYRSVIFYQNDQQRDRAEKFIEKVDRSGMWVNPIVTSLEPFKQFHIAESYHQDYLDKNPGGYTCHYPRTQSY